MLLLHSMALEAHEGRRRVYGAVADRKGGHCMMRWIAGKLALFAAVVVLFD